MFPETYSSALKTGRHDRGGLLNIVSATSITHTAGFQIWKPFYFVMLHCTLNICFLVFCLDYARKFGAFTCAEHEISREL